MPQHSKENILAGRTAVDVYRADHAKLYSKPWHRSIPREHTPLLDKLQGELKEGGFKSLDEFFDASEELNKMEASKMYRREGECNRCGKCCRTCKYLLETGECAIYDDRPQVCIDSPFAMDYLGGLPKECTYRFVRTDYKSDLDVEWR